MFRSGLCQVNVSDVFKWRMETRRACLHYNLLEATVAVVSVSRSRTRRRV